VNHFAHLWLFTVLVFGVMVLPGLDMAYIVSSALTGGRSNGFVALAGVVTGGFCHVLLAAVGFSAVIRVVPGAFNVLLVAGAAYIAWIGISLWRSNGEAAPQEEVPVARAASGTLGTFRQGMAICLMNPKAYLFMLAVFPQFFNPSYGSLLMQAVVLSLIIALNQCLVYGGLVVASSRLSQWFAGAPAARRIALRSVGTMLIAAALYTGFEGWRTLA
jgi:threonine/homoserine/homoserine lactone efflux protein